MPKPHPMDHEHWNIDENGEGRVEIKTTHRRKFIRIIEDLKCLMEEIWEYCPDANIYLQEDDFNLMKGPSHVGYRDQPVYDNSVALVTIPKSGGGGW
jgi:hypothetical protein